MIVLAAYGVRQAQREYKRRKAEKAARRGGQSNARDARESEISDEDVDEASSRTTSTTRNSTNTAPAHSDDNRTDIAALDDIRQYQKYIEHQSTRYENQIDDPPSYDQVLANDRPLSTASSLSQSTLLMSDRHSDHRIHPLAQEWMYELRSHTDPLMTDPSPQVQRQPPLSSSFNLSYRPPSILDHQAHSSSRPTGLEETYSSLDRFPRPQSESSDLNSAMSDFELGLCTTPTSPVSPISQSTQPGPHRGTDNLRISALVSSSDDPHSTTRRPVLAQPGSPKSDVTLTSTSGRRRKRNDSSSSSSGGQDIDESSDKDVHLG